MKKLIPIVLLCLLFSVDAAHAQMERQRVSAERPVELAFPTPRHINLFTTEPLAKGELYYSIMHVFSTVENGASDFWGLDSGANVRFSLEYGFTDRFSVFVGRSSLDKVYESGFRWHLLRQTTAGSVPLSISLVASGGIMTEDFTLFDIEMSFADRLNAALSLPVSRKFNDRFSLMVSPVYAVFSETNPLMRIEYPEDDMYAGLGSGLRYKITNRVSLTAQHAVAYRPESGSTSQNFGLGLDLETGGHVFQLFFVTSQALNDQYLLAAPNGNISDYGFRFGFNVNRSFSFH